MRPTFPSVSVEQGVGLAPFTTLRAGGPAEWLARVRSVDALAEVAIHAQEVSLATTYLGWGSNVLPSDRGVPGLVVLNRARTIDVDEDGRVEADSGCGFQELCLRTLQAGLRGLEFAVGIPGTLGGALVSNAGAYRSSVSEFLTAIEIVAEGERRWVEPAYLKFSYRDSILRRSDPPPLALLRVRLQLGKGDAKQGYDEAREYQRQRIGKQPPPASAGSFFKNVERRELAAEIETLPPALREKGIVPAGYLIEKVGLKGFQQGGAKFAERHANFIVNVGGASARAIRTLAEIAKERVAGRYGIVLEEEVLYLGDWSDHAAEA